MNNPLSEEQIQKLNEISQLRGAEQQQELQRFLQTLNPEQVEFLKNQQNSGGQCAFCLIAEGKVPCHKVYEDNNLIGVLDINPATKGHVILFPKKHCGNLGEIKDVKELFSVANKISEALLKVGAEGTNIFAANGEKAGQMCSHFLIHIIPRYSNDGVRFGWEHKKFDDDEMKDISEKIKRNFPEDRDKQKTKVIEQEAKKILYSEKERIG